MFRPRKHVIPPCLFRLVSVFRQIPQISCQCLRIAGNVDYFFRSEGYDRGQEGFIAACSRWVHEDYVGFFAFFGHGDHEGAGVVLVEGDVFDLVSFGVCYGIADGVGVQFDADDFFRVAGCNEADGSDSAVSVHDALVSGKAGQGDGFFVQVFRLNRVDLVEGLRGDAEGAAAEFILDVTASEEDNVTFSEYHAVGAIVDVQYDRGDLRVEFAQGFYEVVFRREDRRYADEDDHDLAGGKTGAHHNVAQEAVAAVLVVDHDFKALQQTADIADDGIGALVLEQALVNRDHFVCALFVNAGYDRSVFFVCKGGVDFIPIMIGIFHADHAFDRDNAFQCFLQELLFFRELLLVGKIQICASAAFFLIRTFR